MISKPVKRVDVSMLTADEREALAQLIRGAKAAAPDVKALQDTAQQVFAEWLKSSQWGVTDGVPEDVWRVGAPAVNYVDHIERPS